MPTGAYRQLDSEANRLYQRWLSQWNFLASDRALTCDPVYLANRSQEERKAFDDYATNIRDRIRILWENKVSSEIAKLADERTRPTGDGYVAERHPSLSELVLVWAPCGCVWVGSDKEAFVTPCGKDSCMFSWEDAKTALAALQATEGGKDGGSVHAVSGGSSDALSHSVANGEAPGEPAPQATSDSTIEEPPK